MLALVIATKGMNHAYTPD